MAMNHLLFVVVDFGDGDGDEDEWVDVDDGMSVL